MFEEPSFLLLKVMSLTYALEPAMTIRNFSRVCPLLMPALGEMVPDHRVHLIIVLEGGLGHLGPGLNMGERSKKMPNMLHLSSLPHSAAPKEVQYDERDFCLQI